MEPCQIRMVNTRDVEGTSNACGRCVRNCRNGFGCCFGDRMGADACTRAGGAYGCGSSACGYRACSRGTDTRNGCAGSHNSRRRSAAGSHSDADMFEPERAGFIARGRD